MNDLFKIHGINSFKTTYRRLCMLCHFYPTLLNILYPISYISLFFISHNINFLQRLISYKKVVSQF